MTRTILSSRIHPNLFRIPEPSFEGEENPEGVKTVVVEATDGLVNDGGIERVEGEVLADFSTFGVTRDKTTGDEEEEKPDATQKAEEARKAEEAKKASETDDATKKAADEAAKKVTEDETKKKAEEAKKNFKSPSDKELDEQYKLKDNAPEKLKGDFSKVKDIVRSQRTVIEERETELATLRQEVEALKQNGSKIPDDVQAELDELRATRQQYLLQDDPILKKEFEEKTAAADDSVYKWLEKQGVRADVVKDIKDNGKLDNLPTMEDFAKRMTPRQKQEFDYLMRDRVAVAFEHEKKINALKGQKDGAIKLQTERQEAEAKNFGAGFQQHMIKRLSTTDKWAEVQEIPKDATPEQRKLIEASNKQITDAAETFKEKAAKLYQRDPQMCADLVMDSMHKEKLLRENAAKDGEIEKLSARVKELETKLGSYKKAGKVVDDDASRSTNTAQKSTMPDGGDADSAWDAYKKNKSA